MKGTLGKVFTVRLNFVHLAVIVMLGGNCFADGKNLFKAFNPNYKIQTRGPQSHIPDVDYTPAPERVTSWYEHVLVESDAGVLKSMKRDFDRWDEEENYVTNWNLQSTGLYPIKSRASRKTYFSKRILRYFDKRLSGEVKKAEKGSTLASVGNVQTALRPNTKVSVSKNVKLKFKAKVLQGMAIMKVVNPYVDYNASYSFSDGLKMKMKKEFKGVRATASVDYKPEDKTYVTNFDKNLTDTVSARVSSSQADDAAIFSNDSNSSFQLMYSSPFNF